MPTCPDIFRLLGIHRGLMPSAAGCRRYAFGLTPPSMDASFPAPGAHPSCGRRSRASRPGQCRSGSSTALLREERGWLAGLFGAVRDTDVLLERLQRQAGNLAEHGADRLARLLGDLARQREAVRTLTPDASDEELHRVRSLAKRCRYAAEAAAPAIGRRGQDFAKAVARLQTVLGDHQDAVVAEGWLRAWLQKA